MNRNRAFAYIGFIIIFSLGIMNGAAMGNNQHPSSIEIATLGGGCFWCIEAVFEEVDGVVNVISGYAGGHVENPTYEQVSTGTTGHAEVCQIYFDTTKISYREILEIFFSVHDPTTLNRQGADVGEQYRSIILYHSPQQKKIAETLIAELDQAKVFNNPIVTEVKPLKTFYPAEEYHQDYFKKHPNQAYCALVIQPKLEKFRKHFPEKRKKE